MTDVVKITKAGRPTTNAVRHMSTDGGTTTLCGRTIDSRYRVTSESEVKRCCGICLFASEKAAYAARLPRN